MKRLIPTLILALVASCPMTGRAQKSLENDPAYLAIDKALDLKTTHPQVNVNLPRFLLQDAASALNGGPDDPFAGTGVNFEDLTKEIKLIRVVVFEADDDTRAVIEKGVKTLRAELEAKWTPIVSVPDDHVGVYARSDESGESMAGLALLVDDGGDTVIANVVGKVSIGKIIKIASRMDKIPKDLLKGLGGMTGSEPAQGADAAPTSSPTPSTASSKP